jgi:hypothetical protein
MTTAKLSIVVLSLGLAGCSGDVYNSACTLIGCEDGLAIDVQGAVPASYTVTLEAPDGAPRVFECGPTRFCQPLFVAEFMPETVEVRVQAEGVDFTAEFTPTYSVSRPNGPDCPPECRQATIRVVVP